MSSTRPYNFPEGWSFEALDVKKEYFLPAGTYYIGDLCYVCDEDIYDEVYDQTGYESGLYTLKDKGSFLVATTAYGDGGYEDSLGNTYGVDAGIIGILNLNLLDEEKKTSYLGNVMTFPNGVKCMMTDRMGEEVGKPDGFYEFSWIDENNKEQTMTIRTDGEGEEEENEESA